jgi:hypothetical protein
MHSIPIPARTHPSRTAALLTGLVLAGMLASSHALGSHRPSRAIATPDGRPIRKIYVRAPSMQDADSAATQIAQDTCMTVVSTPDQADAVLDVSVALPDVAGGAPSPGIFTPANKVQTLANARTESHASASANCTDSKGKGGCVSSTQVDAGDVTDLPATQLPGAGGSGLEISLASVHDESQELWEPNARAKRSWTQQLRVAAGCPVCPGERFNPRKYPTYRAWIAARCPAALAGGR